MPKPFKQGLGAKDGTPCQVVSASALISDARGCVADCEAIATEHFDLWSAYEVGVLGLISWDWQFICSSSFFNRSVSKCLLFEKPLEQFA